MPQNKKNNQNLQVRKELVLFQYQLARAPFALLVAISFLILGGSLALGIGVGYFAFLVEDTAAPSKEELQQELTDITETSQLAYADGSKIATIRSDLMRTSVSSDKISDYLKKRSLQQKTNISISIMASFLKRSSVPSSLKQLALVVAVDRH